MKTVSIQKKNTGDTILAEVREIVLNHSVRVYVKDYNTAEMKSNMLEFVEKTRTYENDVYSVSHDAIYDIAAPSKVVRVRKPRGYGMGKVGCRGPFCK